MRRPPPSPLLRAARRTEWRLRTNEALKRGSTALVATLGAAALWVTYIKVAHGGHPVVARALGALAGLGALATLALVAWAYLRRRPPLWGALRLDAAHETQSRVSNALA